MQQIPDDIYAHWFLAQRPHAVYNLSHDIEKFWRANMGSLGAVLTEGEVYPGDGSAWRAFERGAVRWHPQTGAELVLKP